MDTTCIPDCNVSMPTKGETIKEEYSSTASTSTSLPLPPHPNQPQIGSSCYLPLHTGHVDPIQTQMQVPVKPQQPIQMMPQTNAAYQLAPMTYSPLYGKMPASSHQLRALKRKQDALVMNSVPPTTGRRARSGGVDKNSKGLRHFSLKVCEKVRQKGKTTYNEVADELVSELTSSIADPRTTGRRVGENLYDSKNIRRRVYDALNVLMAMRIITKEKKAISWVGLPSQSADECVHLQKDRRVLQERIRKKKAHLYELIIQQVAFKNLVKRNELMEETMGKIDDTRVIQLPYIIVNANADTQIDCEMAEDGTEYFFQFSQPFAIHDEIEVLKRMNMAQVLENGTCSAADINECQMLVPEEIRPYVI
eukprot:Ihof_evm3s47 gene=Ihof_evmTU3s47